MKETRERISKVATSKELAVSSWQQAEVVGVEQQVPVAAIKGKKQKALPMQTEMTARERALMDI